MKKKKERRAQKGREETEKREREREREGKTRRERLTTPYARVKEGKGRERERERGSGDEMGLNDDDSVEGGGNAVDHRDTGPIRGEPRSPRGSPYLYSHPSCSVLPFPLLSHG